MAVTVRRPIAEGADRGGVWSPDPAKIVGIGPIAISVEILCAPNVFVVILDVVLESLGQILLTLADPIVNRVACRRGELPVAHVLAADDELGRAAIAQSKPGRIGLYSRASAIADRQTHSTIARHVDPV